MVDSPWILENKVLRFTGELPGGARFAVSLKGSGDCGIGAGDENRREFVRTYGIIPVPELFCQQVHGDRIYRVGRNSVPPPFDGYDAIVSPNPVNIGVFTADCLGIALISPDGQRAVVHSGWRGTAANIVGKAVELMKSGGASASELRAVFGPSAGPCCYGVGPEFREIFPHDSLVQTAAGLYFDNARTVREQLLAADLTNEFIYVNPYCTICNNDIFFSYRRERQNAGRMFHLLSG